MARQVVTASIASSDFGDIGIRRAVHCIRDGGAHSVAAAEDNVPLHIINRVGCLVGKGAVHPLEADVAAVAYGQGARKAVPIVYGQRANDKAGGDIHHVDGAVVPTVAEAVRQFIADFALVGTFANISGETAGGPVTFAASTAVGFDPNVVGGSADKSVKMTTVRCCRYGRGIGEVGEGCVFHDPATGIGGGVPAK